MGADDGMMLSSCRHGLRGLFRLALAAIGVRTVEVRQEGGDRAMPRRACHDSVERSVGRSATSVLSELLQLTAALGRVQKMPELSSLLQPQTAPAKPKPATDWNTMLAQAEAWVASC